MMNKKGAETKILEILTKLSLPVQEISQRKQDQILYNLEKSSILSKNEKLLTNEIDHTLESVNEEAFKQHKIGELQTTHYAQLLQIAKDINVNDLSTMTQGDRKRLIKQLSGATTKLTPEERAAIAAQKKAEAAKLKAMTSEERKAMATQVEGGVDYKNLSDQELWKLADDRGAELEKNAEKILRARIADKSLQDHVEGTKTPLLKKVASAEGIAFNETTSQADLRNAIALKRSLPEIKQALSNLLPAQKVERIEKTLENENIKFANLLVEAYGKQYELANPGEKPERYLYPENIVVTALLAFFVKVANDKTELNALSFLMDGKNPLDDSSFTKELYFQNIQFVDQIVKDSQNNPEPAFLMTKGFEAFESIFSQPVNYLGSTPYRGQVFPDCGETSLRNVLGIFLSGNNGGVISEKALDSLKQKLSTNMPLENSPFSKMMTYFSSHRDLTSAASAKSHADWAEVVSDLNQGQAPSTLNDVRYGRSNDTGVNTYEIKSNVDENVKGIVNMFNIIAKLIPDEILNDPWSDNREERLQQISVKLVRFCGLLSWGDLELAWENESTKDNTIDNEFLNIVFMDQGAPIFKWQFVPGHFQLDPAAIQENDWRIQFQNQEEKTFSNEWMASLFLKADENKWLRDNKYGTRFPLFLIYSKDLRSTDGALKILSFVFYENIEEESLIQFQPLISRWIEKSIPLNDPYSLDKISLLLYSCNNIPQIQNL